MNRDPAESAPTLFESLRAHHLAEVTGVSERMAPRDSMYRGNDEHYRSVGRSAWRCITTALLSAGVTEPRSILDMSCGAGRVLRVLARAFPNAALTACDLVKDGVDFCAEEFGATPVYSDVDLSKLAFESPFDLIWCGSLLTHLDAPLWLAPFRVFLRSLAPGGVAVVTLHGRWVAFRMRQGIDYGLPRDRIDAILAGYDAKGFGYADYVDQTGYGASVCTPAWILGELASWEEFRVVGYAEKQWDDHQDVLAIQRIA